MTVTLDELRTQYERGEFGHIPSRFHKTACRICGALVTNQAMGRAQHMRMHQREKQKQREVNPQP